MAPARSVVTASALTLAIVAAVSASGESTKAGGGVLLQVQTVCRHGARAPLASYPTDPHAHVGWENGAANLVPAGVAEQFRLGVELRRRYGGLIPWRSCHGIHVTASERNRTHESARALLLGLFQGTRLGRAAAAYGGGRLPPGEPLCPIRTQPEASDYVLRLISAQRCPALMCGIADRLRAAPEYAVTAPALKRVLAEHAGVADAGSLDVVHVFDTLRTQRALGLQLPAWTRRPLLGAPGSPTVLAAMEALFEGAFAAQGAPRLRHMSAGGLMRTLVDNMRPGGPRLAVFAAHDSTLAALAAALGVFSGVPATSSCLLLELYATDSGGRVVRLLRRSGGTGAVTELDLGCGGRPCPLAKLRLLPWLPRSVSQVKEACQRGDTAFTDTIGTH